MTHEQLPTRETERDDGDGGAICKERQLQDERARWKDNENKECYGKVERESGRESERETEWFSSRVPLPE